MSQSADILLAEVLAARADRVPCALVTVASVRGSVPRHAGAKMIVYGDRRISGTVGGGKFESLAADAAIAALADGAPVLKTYSLREDRPDSFGAICGGEVTVLIEPQGQPAMLVVVGAGHCAQAIARLARQCGWSITVIDDRAELLSAERFPDADQRIAGISAGEFIAGFEWTRRDALVLVSRNFEIDRAALAAALPVASIAYVGMIGSRRKVLRVLDDLKASQPEADFGRVFAPIGLDIGADSPAEIAVSVMAEIIAVQRGGGLGHLRLNGARDLQEDRSCVG